MDNRAKELATLADRMRDLAERLMRIPVMYGVDQGDVDQLIEAAAEIERLEKLAKREPPAYWFSFLKSYADDDGGIPRERISALAIDLAAWPTNQHAAVEALTKGTEL